MNYKNLRSYARQAAQPVISNSSLSDLDLEFPISVEEQKRIVAILDQAFANIDKAKANAEKNLKNARELFDSFLHNVFMGSTFNFNYRLMSDQSLLEMIDGDRGVNYPKKKDFINNDGFCLFLNTKNVRPNGFLFDETMFISEQKDKLLRKGRLKRNDVVLTTRGTIGNIALFDDSIKYENIRINSGMLILRPNTSEILPSYLFEVMRSGLVKKQIEEKTSGAAQPQLPIKTLNSFLIPVPKSLDDQKLIVSRLKEFEIEIQSLALNYQNKKHLYDELKASILSKAFSGQLTSTKDKDVAA